MLSEIRKDYIEEKYVIIAPDRGKRPFDVAHRVPGGRRSTGDCHFCPRQLDREKCLLEVGPHGRWRIKVIPNRFPIVSPDNPKAYGHHEVVIETPDHKRNLEDLPATHLTKLLDVYADRTKACMEDSRIEYILIFKNSGERAGASITHAHSQILGTDFVPPHLFEKAQRLQAYRLRTGRCEYCDILRRELASPRKVYADKHIVAFAPFASQYGYEVWVLPRRHVDNITNLSAAERAAWARALKRLLQKVNRLGLPYNYYFHQVVRNEDEHLYMKIVPRISVVGPVELGIGIAVNMIRPEDAARYYQTR